MKKVGLKVNHYKQKDNYRFVILSENGESERFPKTVQVFSFCLFNFSTRYLFDLCYDDGKREFFIEDEEAQTVVEAEEMENAQDWKYRHEMILYKKSDKWHIFCYGSGDELLGEEIVEDLVYLSEYEQNNKTRFHIFQINFPQNFELDSDEIIYAKDCNSHTVILAHELGREPESYVWIDGEHTNYPDYACEICYVQKQNKQVKCLWHADSGKLEKV